LTVSVLVPSLVRPWSVLGPKSVSLGKLRVRPWCPWYYKQSPKNKIMNPHPIYAPNGKDHGHHGRTEKPVGLVTAWWMESFAGHRPQPVESRPRVESIQARSCSPHNDATNYIDKPDPYRHGWIKTTCRQCGKFIGYRPEVITQ
jgi:hypothetical protein